MAHLQLARGAWVFIGDGQKALFLINEGDEKFPNLRRLAVDEHPDPRTREQGSDKPGRAYSSVGNIRSAVQQADWHEIEKERFAATIADRINRAAHANAFQQLVVVAPPKVLAALRPEFSKEAAAKIAAELDKDLTNHPIDQIERLLTAH
jgi:protein required for attachment to host cells